jgi:hypothetical protein
VNFVAKSVEICCYWSVWRCLVNFWWDTSKIPIRLHSLPMQNEGWVPLRTPNCFVTCFLYLLHFGLVSLIILVRSRPSIDHFFWNYIICQLNLHIVNCLGSKDLRQGDVNLLVLWRLMRLMSLWGLRAFLRLRLRLCLGLGLIRGIWLISCGRLALA